MSLRVANFITKIERKKRERERIQIDLGIEGFYN
jgi:hypothetical protein